MGALGAGGWILGRVADRRADPWRLYARLEALVAITAALTPPLLWAARAAYLGVGGTTVLGPVFGTLLRLGLAALVLLPPMFLAGGTLPAAARAVESAGDRGRRHLALLYGVNTLGAVAGALAATFAMLEPLGTRRTLWLACLLNLLIAVLARAVSFRGAEPAVSEDAAAEPPPPVPPALVFTAAGIVGFAFFLMELVWYRMLAPILGGTVYTFGLTLAVALAGIGVGGLAYSAFGRGRRATAGAFAATCLAEAACLAVPFVLGDRIAALALRLRPAAPEGLADHVAGWVVVAGAVILPAAIVAGFQFPLLVALLGRGRAAVGRQVGQAYAWNTAGAIAGSLAGGFGLLPLLTAPGCWRATAAALAITGVLSAVIGKAHRLSILASAVAAGVLVAALAAAPGPTAAWRHSGIGAGRSAFRSVAGANQYAAWRNHARRVLVWEAEGVESSIGLVDQSGLAFLVNGKIDGNARRDAPTQVMSGLLGALLHPAPRTSLVVGLGTGSTAGWLAAVPSMERTDVVELEPAIAEVARACAPVNRDVLAHPRVFMRYGDAREVLMTTPETYDLVFSEPSNPYRAGIASLFTREFYRSAAARLRPGGLFLQWMQAYEVDDRTIYSVLTTLHSVFPSVSIWQTLGNDLLLVGSFADPAYDAARLSARVGEEPFRSALRGAWSVDSLEGVLARHVAAPPLIAAIAAEGHEVNTDDRNPVEFGFARTVGRGGLFRLDDFRRAARRAGADRPAITGTVDWPRVARERVAMDAIFPLGHSTLQQEEGVSRETIVAHALFASGRRREAAQAFLRGGDPAGPVETTLVAEGLADAADARALPFIETVGRVVPAEGDALRARLLYRQGRVQESVDALERGLLALRADPWPAPAVMANAIALAVEVATVRRETGPRLFAALERPFSVSTMEAERLNALFRIAQALPVEPYCRAAIEGLDRPPFWNLDFLLYRRNCHEATGDARAASAAAADVARYLANERESGGETTPGVPVE